MIRGALLILTLVIVVAAAGVGLCRALRVPMNVIELAAVVGLIAGEVALLPIGLYRGTDPAVRFQMAWLGSILHLVLSAGLGAAAFFVLHPPATAFVISLLAIYWVTLAGVCGLMVRLLRTPGRAGFSQGQTAGGTGILPGNPG